MPLSLEEQEERAIRGQKKLLADMLKRGIPLVYVDEHDRLVKKHPDGRIEVIKEQEHADHATALRA